MYKLKIVNWRGGEGREGEEEGRGSVLVNSTDEAS